MDVYGRVARLLLDLAEAENGTLVIGEKLTQQDIASRVGASREMISRILKDLTAGGYISADRSESPSTRRRRGTGSGHDAVRLPGECEYFTQFERNA